MRVRETLMCMAFVFVLYISSVSIYSCSFRGPVRAANYPPVGFVRGGTVTWGSPTTIIQPGDSHWFTINAPGVTPSMRVGLYTSQDFTTVPGFVPSIGNGTITMYPPYVSPPGTINVKFVNLTSNPIQLGPVTLGWGAYTQ